MKLEDFYFADKHEAGSRMPIMLPNGKDSGEWLQVRGPAADESIKAARAYAAALRQLDDSLAPLEEECKAKNNYVEWNSQRAYGVEELNTQLAEALVCGWSFEDPFTPEALAHLLHQYKGLAAQVGEHHTKTQIDLSAK